MSDQEQDREYEGKKLGNKKYLKKMYEAKKAKRRGYGKKEEPSEEEENSVSGVKQGDEEEEEEEDEEEEKVSRRGRGSPKSAPSSSKNSPTTTNSMGSPTGFDDAFVNPEEEFNTNTSQEIHVHAVLRPKKTNKFDTVVTGLCLDNSSLKELLSKIKTKFGIGGSIAIREDFDTKPILVFMGNYVDEIQMYLAKELKKDIRFIIAHN